MVTDVCIRGHANGGESNPGLSVELLESIHNYIASLARSMERTARKLFIVADHDDFASEAMYAAWMATRTHTGEFNTLEKRVKYAAKQACLNLLQKLNRRRDRLKTNWYLYCRLNKIDKTWLDRMINDLSDDAMLAVSAALLFCDAEKVKRLLTECGWTRRHRAAVFKEIRQAMKGI